MSKFLDGAMQTCRLAGNGNAQMTRQDMLAERVRDRLDDIQVRSVADQRLLGGHCHGRSLQDRWDFS